MEAYLDNAATTRVLPEVRQCMVKVLEEDYGNPSSMHLKGVEAERYVKEAAKTLSGILKVDSKEILFTSGGTEANNLAIIGAAMANRRSGNHIITTAVEHASVLRTMEYLEEQGFRVTYLPVNEAGVVDPQTLEQAIEQDTILVSVMAVNNEVGAVMPIEALSKVIREKKPEILFHVDAIQAFGKYELYPRRMSIDLLSVSGHKFHSPKGIGFLYKRDKVKIKPLILGGGQQGGMRSGTENVPGIAGMGKAAALVYSERQERVEKLYALKEYFLSELLKFDNVRLNSTQGRQSAPHIVNVSFLGVRSEVLLHALEDKGVYVSAGSACSANKRAESATLKAMGLSAQEKESAIRFSFCLYTTKEEVDAALEALRELLPMLRKYTRK